MNHGRLVLCIFLLLSTRSFAQIKPFTLGPKLEVQNVFSEYTGNRQGYSGGIFTRVKIWKLYLQNELLNSSLTQTDVLNIAGTHYKITSVLKSLEFGTYAGYAVINNPLFNFRVFAGYSPSYGYKERIRTVLPLQDKGTSAATELFHYVDVGVGLDAARFTTDFKVRGLITADGDLFPSVGLSVGFKLI